MLSTEKNSIPGWGYYALSITTALMGGISASALLFSAIYTHVPVFLAITGTLSNFILMTALFWHGGAERVKSALFDKEKFDKPLALLVIISASICSCLDILQAYLSFTRALLPAYLALLPFWSLVIGFSFSNTATYFFGNLNFPENPVQTFLADFLPPGLARLRGQHKNAGEAYSRNRFLEDIAHVLVVAWCANFLGYACQQSTLASLLGFFPGYPTLCLLLSCILATCLFLVDTRFILNTIKSSSSTPTTGTDECKKWRTRVLDAFVLINVFCESLVVWRALAQIRKVTRSLMTVTTALVSYTVAKTPKKYLSSLLQNIDANSQDFSAWIPNDEAARNQLGRFFLHSLPSMINIYFIYFPHALPLLFINSPIIAVCLIALTIANLAELSKQSILQIQSVDWAQAVTQSRQYCHRGANDLYNYISAVTNMTGISYFTGESKPTGP